MLEERNGNEFAIRFVFFVIKWSSWNLIPSESVCRGRLLLFKVKFAGMCVVWGHCLLHMLIKCQLKLNHTDLTLTSFLMRHKAESCIVFQNIKRS